MPRPRRMRVIREEAPIRFFKPQGIPLRDLQDVVLTQDGLEALRLADVERLEHAAAAVLMGVSRPTFSRQLAEARATVAAALVRGWAIRIEGGTVCLADDDEIAAADIAAGTCPSRGLRRRRGHCARSQTAAAAGTDPAGEAARAPMPSPALAAQQDSERHSPEPTEGFPHDDT
ncbi:MAG: DUF134 domain-containing protein [Methylacidiphilales bacterium]|nr:DUF134 domain-containing protein [Candidatus Methylacidiphilales bacterium]